MFSFANSPTLSGDYVSAIETSQKDVSLSPYRRTYTHVSPRLHSGEKPRGGTSLADLFSAGQTRPFIKFSDAASAGALKWDSSTGRESIYCHFLNLWTGFVHHRGFFSLKSVSIGARLLRSFLGNFSEYTYLLLDGSISCIRFPE